ncbi:hypothetical protein E3N88_19249 [Mikania micrantha]|uniref:Uncharacterized protein n=1 Tax=Mikania micrantha TaxID=192012 RepID=A0A5N6NPL2_9ASTR|nr:hypothetical protein E3N88_19249 [Mikania micrantha]
MATPEISCAGVKSQQLGAGFSKEKVEEGLAGGGGCRTPSLIWLPIEHTVCVGSWGWRLECERWRWTGLGIAGAEPGVVAGGVRWSFIGGQGWELSRNFGRGKNGLKESGGYKATGKFRVG